MTNFIPIFPLGVVVYPGESLNLHIFEPRYIQLVNECHAEKKPFGIPTIINNNLNEMGTLVEITELTKTYDNGEMDIKTQGLKVFRTLEVLKQVPDKLFSGAIVNYPDNIEGPGKPAIMQKVVAAIRELHRLLKVQKEFKKPDDQLTSYDIAHHAGLSLEEEYELLGLLKEVQRQEYLKRHLRKVLPVIAEMEQLKEKIKLNGHFKNLSSLDFDLPGPVKE
ncbi:MAG TPA: LON peptidase substrate-binding domain-containing protein [Chitinophagaceae bacterium]|jgi:Lon protease-like protein|nr:LON peptidase substrate-binding domain-containing protein [Chitinophagaceae bacterium]